MIPDPDKLAAATAAEANPYWLGMKELVDRVNSLTSEVEALRKDKARLDWLELQEHRQMVENENVTLFLVWYPWLQTAWGKTYREALDEAMAMEPLPLQQPL